MIEFLKDYSEKREKVEEEKVNILKAMHEEKKHFFSQFSLTLKIPKSSHYRARALQWIGTVEMLLSLLKMSVELIEKHSFLMD